MRRPRRPAQDLRFAVECMPRHTRVAMLEGIEANAIIVGAYTNRDGGVCPMLAAHRRGGRTSLVSFAHAWDRYTRAGRRSRPASDREVRTLKTMLKASLLNDDSARSELADAVAELEAIKARRVPAAEEAPKAKLHEAAENGCAEEVTGAPQPGLRTGSGDLDRSEELASRHGWSWLRVFRRLDEYEAALDRVRRAERKVEQRETERV